MTSYYLDDTLTYISRSRDLALYSLTIFNRKISYRSLKQTADSTSCPWTTILVSFTVCLVREFVIRIVCLYLKKKTLKLSLVNPYLVLLPLRFLYYSVLFFLLFSSITMSDFTVWLDFITTRMDVTAKSY